MLNNLRIFLLCALLGAAQLFVFASAEVVPGVYVIRNVAFPIKVVDENRITHTANGWGPTGGANQKWHITLNLGLFTIQNCETKRNLGVRGAIAVTAQSYAPSLWNFIADAEGRYSIDASKNGIGLTGNNFGSAISFGVDTKRMDQKWHLEYKGATC